MKIISWNTNGLRATLKQGLLAPLLKEKGVEILCLQETKVHPDQLQDEEKNLLGFTGYFSNSETRKGYSGVAIYTKNKPLSVTNKLPKQIEKKYKLADDKYGNPNDEGRILALEFEKFFVVSIYTPNAKPDLSRLELRYKKWDPAFLEFMKQLEKKKPVIFCGDLNVAHTELDLAKPKENEGEHGFTHEEREGMQSIIDAGFVDTFRVFHKGNGHYTWWSHFAKSRERNVGWRIDYFMVSNSLKDTIKDAGISDKYPGSDHCPIWLEID